MKTYKREFAITVALFWAGFCIWGVYDAQALRVAEFITWPCLALAASAFGLDAIAKQFGGRGPVVVEGATWPLPFVGIRT